MFVEVPEIFILVPTLLDLKGDLEMTLASRLSTQVTSPLNFTVNYLTFSRQPAGYLFRLTVFVILFVAVLFVVTTLCNLSYCIRIVNFC